MKLNWNAVGERYFETGVDRGVLYVAGSAEGVPWNGLVAVNEAPTGGEITPSYIDGIRYLNDTSSEEFQAIVEAYTYPDEFEQCDGTISVKNGLFGTLQKRKSFGLSYRTRVGNDVGGLKHAYKIHLIYNATASPSPRSNKSVGDTIEPDNFSWGLSTIPVAFKGHRPTSHFIIDSRDTPVEALKIIEDVLYGTDETPARLPSAGELVYIFESFDASFFDAGRVGEIYYGVFDGGRVGDLQTSIIDGGSL